MKIYFELEDMRRVLSKRKAKRIERLHAQYLKLLEKEEIKGRKILSLRK